MSILPELYYLIVHMWYSFVNNLRHFRLFSGFHWLPRIQFNVVLCNHMTLKVKLSLICFNNIYVLGTVMDFRLIKTINNVHGLAKRYRSYVKTSDFLCFYWLFVSILSCKYLNLLIVINCVVSEINELEKK